MRTITALFGTRARYISAAALVAVLAACGGGSDSTGPSDPPAPPPSTTTKLRMTNSSSLSAWYVYVRSCGATSWGADRLGSNVLSPGESASLNLQAGCYDVRAETSAANNKQAIFMGLQISSGETEQVTITAWNDK